MVRTQRVGMILAAGLGTRLRPLTFEMPKPVVPVLGRPLVSYTLDFLSRHGFRDVVINLHRLPGIVKNRLLEWGGFKGNLKFVIEPEILGTGGGVKNALQHFGKAETITVVNSDTIVDFDLEKAIHFHRRKKALITLVLFPLKNKKYTPLLTDGKDRIISVGKTGNGSGPYFYPGVSILHPSVIERIPQGKACLIRDLVIPLIEEGEIVCGFCTEGRFLEFGTPEEYLDNTLTLLEEAPHHSPKGGDYEVIAPVFISPEATIGKGAVIGPHAVLEGKSVVGKGATVTRSIVWPGGMVDPETETRGAVVTPHRIVYVKKPSP